MAEVLRGHPDHDHGPPAPAPAPRPEPVRPETEVKSYRKRPVVVQAMRLSPSNIREVAAWSGAQVDNNPVRGWRVTIQTLEGNMEARMGDWVIKGVDGEFYPCRASIFARTYEVVNP